MRISRRLFAPIFSSTANADVIERYAVMRRETVGAKFYAQAVLHRHGMEVPDFICLSAQAFERAVQPIKPILRELLAPLAMTQRARITVVAQQIRQLLLDLPLQPQLVRSLNDAVARRLRDTERYSVRACMVGTRAELGEDSLTNPFAGISDSFLYVSRDDIWTKIRACWASAFSERAILYRLSQGMDPAEVAVAVGVQRMIFGERSWVLFTCDPNTAARDGVLVAGYGIGEGVVQEAVPVDHYFVNAKSGVIRHQLADKDSALSFDAEHGAGVCRR
ncbi:MAG: phosphoenolpyruvate synthase, partial [Candidatus Obscuribacterales bacterium]|nr:phosphoenolpyruvate synthase [Steroidobacteraceae bacterium]